MAELLGIISLLLQENWSQHALPYDRTSCDPQTEEYHCSHCSRYMYSSPIILEEVIEANWGDLQDETDLATDNHNSANLPRGREPEAKEDAVFVW